MIGRWSSDRSNPNRVMGAGRDNTSGTIRIDFHTDDLIYSLSILSPHTYLPYQSDQGTLELCPVSDHLAVRSLGKY